MEMPNGDTLSARRADCQRGLAIAPNNLLRAKGAGGGGIIPVAAALASFGPEPAVLPLTAPCV
jgi:hypothetical protein